MSKLPTLPSRVSVADLRTVKPAPKQVDPELAGVDHLHWRKAVKARSGWQCQAVLPTGRCPVRYPEMLYADHVLERRDRPDLALAITNGTALCAVHHQQKTLAARALRLDLPARPLGWTLAPQQEPVPEPRPDLSGPGRLTIA